MARTTAAITAYLNHLFVNQAWAKVGDASGLQPAGTVGSLYLSLHTAFPGAGGNQTTSEAAYTGYARVAVARSASQWTVSAPNVTNVNQVTFPPNTGGSETELYWGIGTDSSGAGQLLYSGPFTTVFRGFVAETSGDITVIGSAFSVNDRVAFFVDSQDVSLPTGMTEGQYYWVKTVSADVITISATMGGSAVVLSADGSGYCAKVTPFVIANGNSPALAANQILIIEQ